MKENKTPGMDGIPIEFYKIFWPHISNFLVQVYNEAFKEGELSYSQRTAILSLLFKKGERLLLKNYRPLSLSTTDYKILAFVLAVRLQNVLDEIISTRQGAYIKKRFIGCNVRIIEDVIDYTAKLSDESMILFLDFEKAFDSVEWSFLIEALKKFNFGPDYIRWIKTIYTHAGIRVKNNGWISKTIEIQRGIRQGCPVSALLFIIVVEILAQNIQTDTSIKGIEINNNGVKKELKVNQYADDGHLFLNDTISLHNAIRAINRFSKVAGPELNLQKCEIMPLRKALIEDIDIQCVNNAKCLGIWVGKDKEINCQRNWIEKIEKLQMCLQIWKTRNLTIFGRITIVKMLGLPKLIFSATNTSIPHDIPKTIERIIFDFLWQGNDRIKRKTMIGDVSKGGAGMVEVNSFFSALKASWVNRYLDSGKYADWASLMKFYIDSFGPNNLILHLNFQSEQQFPYMSNMPQFYQEIVTSFNKTKSPRPPNTSEDLRKNIIWGNRYFTYKGINNKPTTLYYKEWIKVNILYVGDILISDGNISLEYIFAKLENKCNIYSEITKLKHALKPYMQLIRNNVPEDYIYTIPDEPVFTVDSVIIDIRNKRSSFYYHEMLKSIFIPPNIIKCIQNINQEKYQR